MLRKNWFTENKLANTLFSAREHFTLLRLNMHFFRRKTNRRESGLVLKIHSDIIDRQESDKFLGVNESLS